jgi:hypothetical protein
LISQELQIIERRIQENGNVSFEELRASLHRENVRQLHKYHMEICQDCRLPGTLCGLGRRIADLLIRT